MYQTGDYVVTSDDGIVKIISYDNSLYRVQPCTPDTPETTLSAPNIVRRIISREKAEEVVDRIAYTRTLQAPNDKLRRQIYQAAFQEFEPLSWVQIIKTAYIRASEQRSNADDLHFSKLATKYLHGELSAALGLPYEAVEAHITNHIQNEF